MEAEGGMNTGRESKRERESKRKIISAVLALTNALSPSALSVMPCLSNLVYMRFKDIPVLTLLSVCDG